MTSRKQKRKQPPPESYRHRTYRRTIDPGGLVSSMVSVRETDLHILAPTDLTAAATDLVFHYRRQLEAYIAQHPRFLSSLTPLPLERLAPPIVRAMLEAGEAAGVGPMAAVAGAIAAFVGRDLLSAGSDEVVVENGGDIFLARKKECVAAIFAGSSPLSNRVGIRVAPERMPLGVCTSSGRVGHSLSLGRADAVTVLAPSVSLADAAATRLGNEIRSSRDIDHALAVARTIAGISGVVAVIDDRLGAWGKVELVRLG